MPQIINGETCYTFEESRQIVGKHIEKNAEELHQRLLARKNIVS